MTKIREVQTGAHEVPAVLRPPQVVITTWRGEQEFDAAKPGAPSIHIDSHGKKGPGPMEALLGALASCAGTDVVEILAKRRTPVASLEVEAVGKRVETTPRRLEHVLLKFRIAGAGIERVHAERAIELSVNKYCSVRDSLDPKIPVEWSLELSS
jgi:putative redox protein